MLLKLLDLFSFAMFKTDTNIVVPGISTGDLTAIRERQINEFALAPVQLSEAAAFSMAMVIRYALGLSAAESRIAAITGPCFQGAVALATLRQLINAGGTGFVIELPGNGSENEEYELLKKQLRSLGAEFFMWKGPAENQLIESVLGSCHNALVGIHNPLKRELDVEPAAVENTLSVLNEKSIPVHAVECPLGVDANTGEKTTSRLFASSTLSLGVPLTGLRPGAEYVGRHYLCDISIPRAIYADLGIDNGTIFSQQPILRIFTVDEEG